MAVSHTRLQQTYDHRLRDLVRHVGHPGVVSEFGVPRSTALGWLRTECRPVVTADVLDTDRTGLQAEVLKLRRRGKVLGAIIGLLVALLRALDVQLEGTRGPQGAAKARLMRAIDRVQGTLSLRVALRILHLSPSRYYQWRRDKRFCELDDAASCPRSMPKRLTATEVLAIKEMVESPEYRHVPTGRLAILAQRLGRVFAAPTTWYRLVRERGWRRPRARVHPAKPKHGVRASEPDELWHVDTTAIRLISGAKVYLHAVIDNFSRKILAWRVTEYFEVATTVAILHDAAQGALTRVESPILVADSGVENVNSGVDGLIGLGFLRRVLALRDVTFSNSMIEAWWRTLKHHWLYLNTLDSVAAVRRLVEFYVAAHNSEIPHSAFRGQPPDEMYAARGQDIPEQLEIAKRQAHAARVQADRAASCALCWQPDQPNHRRLVTA
jgi:transposase InsO family protein